MAVKHTNPTRPRDDRRNRARVWARAPYNFVPLPERLVLARRPLEHDAYQIEGVTGWIECELETCSPTYVRGMLTRKQFEAFGETKADKLTAEQKLEMAPFFSSEKRDDGKKNDGPPAKPKPRIPGSSLRGMIRALVEIISYGRIRNVSPSPTFTFRAVAAAKDDPLAEPYRQVIGPFASKVQAGYLVKSGDDWYIRPAQTPAQIFGPDTRESYLKVKEYIIQGKDIPDYIRLNSPDYRPQVHEVRFDAEMARGQRGRYVRVERIGSRAMPYKHQAVLVCSGNMLETGKSNQKSPRKNHALLMLPDNDAPLLKIGEQAVRDYLDGLTPFQKEKLSDWAGDQGVLRTGCPVFYVRDGAEVHYFGHSPNFRIPARLAVPGALRAATPPDFVSSELRTGAEPDLADAIFGWVADNEKVRTDQRAGRVYVGDAECTTEGDDLWYKPQPITPRTLAGPKATTFQHYLVQDGRAGQRGHHPDNKVMLAHYGTPPDETQLRGHKLYWHKGESPDIEASSKERTHESQLTRIMPLKPGVKFRFKVHFDNLRPEELGALLWALVLPGESGKTYRHKIGMGKPLGMGAVAIMPRLVVTERRDRYTALFAPNQSRTAWQEGSAATEPQQYVAAFERYILQENGIGIDKRRLADVERIQMLLAMLEWREGTREWLDVTRYMEIEYGANKVNEYKERPVLPDPLGVASNFKAQQREEGPQAASVERTGSTRQQNPRQPDDRSKGATTGTQTVAPPPSSGPKVGDVLQTTVYFIERNGDVYLEIAGIPSERMMGRIQAARLGAKQYSEGQAASVQVLAVIDRSDDILVECEPTGMNELTGTVVRFDINKGYGFIKPDGGGADVFVHKNRLQGIAGLHEGDRVAFRIGKGMKGLEAQQVRLLEE